MTTTYPSQLPGIEETACMAEDLAAIHGRDTLLLAATWAHRASEIGDDRRLCRLGGGARGDQCAARALALGYL